MVTASTYRKTPVFSSRQKLDLLMHRFQELASTHDLAPQAWAFFPNHYHFIGIFNDVQRLRRIIQRFHSITAREINRLDRTPERRIWFQYWDSHLTFERSYFARLHYVHENAVHHGVVRHASNYPWCSASWFERKANSSFRKMVLHFPCNEIAVPDSFDVTINDFHPTA